MKLDELEPSYLILESKNTIWSRVNGVLTCNSDIESPGSNSLFTDKKLKTNIRVNNGK